MEKVLWRLLFPEMGETPELPIRSEVEAYVGRKVTDQFWMQLPKLRQDLAEDLAAAFAGDPAAEDEAEIVSCYPGFYAVAIYRMAHILRKLGVSRIPRILTERAHGATGIDIHPGAVIGPGFFIDHGTGVVIGETAVIGSGVKLYQGVTLGALSVGERNHTRGMKRHPTLEDGVTVYANATILGGATVIGRGSIIGANVLLTDSVEPYTQVTMAKPQLRFRNMEEKTGGA